MIARALKIAYFDFFQGTKKNLPQKWTHAITLTFASLGGFWVQKVAHTSAPYLDLVEEEEKV